MEGDPMLKHYDSTHQDVSDGKLHISSFIIIFLCLGRKKSVYLPMTCMSFIQSFSHFAPSKLCSKLLQHPCTDLNETWLQMFHHKSRCVHVYGEIIHVWKFLQELWLLTLRLFTHFTHFTFSLSSQLVHCCMAFNETWQECCTTSLGLHVER